MKQILQPLQNITGASEFHLSARKVIESLHDFQERRNYYG